MFQCQNCTCNFINILHYNKHQIAHKHQSNIKCLYVGCNVVFKNYLSFQQHLLRYHKRSVQGSYTCKHSNCDFWCTNIGLLKKHYLKYSKRITNDLVCPYCLNRISPFKNENALRVHISTSHRHFEKEHRVQPDECSLLSKEPSNNDQQLPMHNVLNELNANSLDVEMLMDFTETEKNINIEDADYSNIDRLEISTKDNSDYEEAVSKKIALLFMSLSSEHIATEAMINKITETIYSTFDVCQNNFHHLLSTTDISDREKNIVFEHFQNSFSGFPKMLHPTTGQLRNSYIRNLFYTHSSVYVKPEEIKVTNKDGVATDFAFTYISILKTLEVALQNEDFRRYCTNVRLQTNCKGFFDLKDGKVIKNSDFFQQENTIHVGLYQDAFEICNPLGSAKGKFKLIAVYMIIFNLPPFLRSKINNIHLVLLCKEKLLNTSGWSKILEFPLRDLKTLESEGIASTFNDSTTIFKGSVAVVLGDNLGSHQIGGFVESFSSVPYFCRYCENSADEFQKNPFNVKPLRTIENYNECVLQSMRSGKIVKGIKANSPLNDLHNYHVCAPGLPPCIAHDLFEGVVPYDLWLAIDYFLKQKWMKIALLNFRINDFQFLRESKQCIPLININSRSKNKKLTGSASQIRRLLTIFPLAIIDCVKNFEDDVWKMVLLLREVCDFVCAPALSNGQVALLKLAIEDYICFRRKCFPLVKLRPKHEYLMHYPELIKEFGPLKHLWTLRCESKHAYFKNIVKHLKNFKNITMTLAEKHQLMQCSRKIKYDNIAEPSDAVSYESKNYDSKVTSLIKEFENKNSIKFQFVCRKVFFCDILYTKGMSVCIGKNMYGNLLICTIDFILLSNDKRKIYFLGNTNEIVLCAEVGVYEIARYKDDEYRSQCFYIFPYSCLLSPDPLLAGKLKHHQIFATKYVPFDLEM